MKRDEYLQESPSWRKLQLDHVSDTMHLLPHSLTPCGHEEVNAVAAFQFQHFAVHLLDHGKRTHAKDQSPVSHDSN